jgi:HAD superfamily hydrolase (TIGR01549 family)
VTETESDASSILDGIELIIFDKDGTLIAFDAMWGGWASDLAANLEAAAGRPITGRLSSMLGYDPDSGRVLADGALAATPMARLRERTHALLVEAGVTAPAAELALEQAWQAPDPVELARPLTDLPELFRRLRRTGRRIALATTDDRAPTERTLAALGVADLVDAIVCADDGVVVKPAPDMVTELCARLGVEPAHSAVVGDSLADLEMGRAAGVGLLIGVLSGVGDPTALAGAADLILASIADLPAG